MSAEEELAAARDAYAQNAAARAGVGQAATDGCAGAADDAGAERAGTKAAAVTRRRTCDALAAVKGMPQWQCNRCGNWFDSEPPSQRCAAW